MAVRYRILLMGIAVLLVFASVRALDRFPLPEEGLLEEKMAGFSGVLRLWISEEHSAAPSGLSAWLIKESARFEKKHDGVYVQITPVSAKTLSSFSYAAELPPDMIVFSPGMLESAHGLVKADVSHLLIEEFRDYASHFCTPVAMGASFWAVRKEEAQEPLSSKALLFGENCALRALHALKTDLSKDAPNGGQYGIDLNLPMPESPKDALVPTALPEIAPGPGSMISEDARSAFIKGEGDALFLSQKELSHLINASNAPEFEIAMTGDLYADQLSLFAVTDTKSGEAREMCVRFLEHLLSEDAQKRLESTKAFSVTGVQLYPAKAHFQRIEMLLTSINIIPAPAFSKPDASHEDALLSVIHGEMRVSDALKRASQP